MLQAAGLANLALARGHHTKGDLGEGLVLFRLTDPALELHYKEN
jgi:hypothetical protein